METLGSKPFEEELNLFKKFADSTSLTKEEKEKCYKSMMVTWSNYTDNMTDIDKGWKEGWIKGWIEGYQEGMEIGKKEIVNEIALKLLSFNTPTDIISLSTGLSIEEIEKLKS